MPIFNFLKKKHQGLERPKSTGNADDDTSPSLSEVLARAASSVTPSIADSLSSYPNEKDSVALRESERTPDIMLLSPGPAPTTATSTTDTSTTSSSTTAAGLDLKKSLSSPATAREQEDMVCRYRSGRDEFDAMLQQETQDIADKLAKQDHEYHEKQQPPRRTRLTFELPKRPPQPPSRSPQPPHVAYPWAQKRYSLPDEVILSSIRQMPKRRSLLRFFSGGCDDSHARSMVLEPTYGDRVKILHRPTLLTGRVRYRGPVEFAAGNDWLGIELDTPVGSNDGERDGKRYFQTGRNRGIFALRSDVELLDDEA